MGNPFPDQIGEGLPTIRREPGLPIPATQLSPNYVRSPLGGALSRQMERLHPGNEVGQEVAGGVHDDHDGEILRPHP